MTKKQYNFVEAYYKSDAVYLSDVYKTYSQAKQHAYNVCMERMHNMNGYAPKILSSNAFHFTLAWLYINESGKECMDVETAYNTYYIQLDI